MNLSQILQEMMEREGKKKQINRGNMKEVLGVVSDLVYESNYEAASTLYKNGLARAKRRKK